MMLLHDTLCDMFVASTALVSLAFLLERCLGASSATRRASIWQAVLWVLLLIPALSVCVPPIAILAGLRTELPSPTGLPQTATSSVGIPWLQAAGLVWIAGLITVAIAHTVSTLRLRRWLVGACTAPRQMQTSLGMCARALGVQTRPRLLLLDTAIPCSTGVRRASIVLPTAAQHWDPERLRAALLHELSHIRRRDGLFDSLSRVAVALYWFQPLVWLADSRFQAQREFACDDAVVGAGVRPSSYATLLIEVGRLFVPQRARLELANPRTLKRRVLALLDEKADRRVTTPRSTLLTHSLFLGIGVLAATLQVRGQQTFWRALNFELPTEAARLEVRLPGTEHVTITGGARSDVVVHATLATQATSPEAAARTLEAIALHTGETLEAVGPEDGDPWSVEFQIVVPRSYDLTIVGGQPELNVRHVAGNISLDLDGGTTRLGGLEGSVDGVSRTGDIQAFLTGSTWRGEGLTLRSDSGSIDLSVSQDYSAQLVAGTAGGVISLNLDESVPPTAASGSFKLGSGGPQIAAFSSTGRVQLARR